MRIIAAPAVALAIIVSAALGCRPEKPTRGSVGPPSILLVVLDTVRGDHAAAGGQGASFSPNLERLAAANTRFAAAWSTAPWTVPSHASMFTGELPSTHGALSTAPRLGNELPTVAEILTASGYNTAAFFSNPWLIDDVTGLLRGFSERLFLPEDAAGEDQGGSAILEATEGWLDANAGRAEPFFVFVNFLEAHSPYDPPANLRSRLYGISPEDSVSVDWIFDFQAGLIAPETVDWHRHRQLYAGDVLHADAFLGKLIEQLEERELLDRIALLVTSDHGESLGEHGFVEHQFRVDEPLLSVPLVIQAPGRLPPGERRDPVLLTDLFATILDLAGLAAGASASSRSLLGPPADSRRPLVAEYSGAPPQLLDFLAARNPAFDRATRARSYRTIRIGHLRLTVDNEDNAVLHDLDADPTQSENIALQRPRAVAALRRILDETTAPARSEDPPEPSELSEETRQRLRALGYIR